jgi:hypothetical protein
MAAIADILRKGTHMDHLRLPADCPPLLADVIRRCLTPSVADRPTAAAVRDLLSAGCVSAKAPGTALSTSSAADVAAAAEAARRMKWVGVNGPAMLARLLTDVVSKG